MFIHTTTQRQSNGCRFLEIWWGRGSNFIMLSVHPQFCELQWLHAYICTELVQNSWMHQLDWGTGVKTVHNILSCITLSSSWVGKPFSLPRNWWLNQIHPIWLGIWMFDNWFLLWFFCALIQKFSHFVFYPRTFLTSLYARRFLDSTQP